MWVILILLAFIAAMTGFIVDFISNLLQSSHSRIANTESSFINFVIWIFYALFFAMVAGSVGKWIAMDAEGSGIPEMKAILGGVNIYRYLGF